MTSGATGMESEFLTMAPADMGQALDVQLSPMQPTRLTMNMHFIIIYYPSFTQNWSEVETKLIRCYYVESAHLMPMQPTRLTMNMHFIIIYCPSFTQNWSEVETKLIRCYYVESVLI